MTDLRVISDPATARLPGISFFCTVCDTDSDLIIGDTKANAHKDRLATREMYYWASCPECGSKVIRYITELAKDPYFQRSRRLQIQRKEMARDLIQPGEYGFQTYYKKEWEKLQAAEAAYELRKRKQEEARLEFLKRNSHDTNTRQAAFATVAAEERLGN